MPVASLLCILPQKHSHLLCMAKYHELKMLHGDEVGFNMKIPQNWSAINASGSPVLPIPASLQANGNTIQPEKRIFLTSRHT